MFRNGIGWLKEVMGDSSEKEPIIEGGMTKQEEAVLTEKHSESRFQQNPNEVVVGKGGKTTYLIQEVRRAEKWLDRVFVFDLDNEFAALSDANRIDTTKIDLNHKINIINLSDQKDREAFMLKMMDQVESAVFSSRYEKTGVYIDGLEQFPDPLFERLYDISKRIRMYKGFLCVTSRMVPNPTDAFGRLFWNAKYFSLFTLTLESTDRLEKEELIQSDEAERLIERRKNDSFLQIAGNQRYWRKV
ncbi:hypothetical protein [Desmospora activa]|uniref:Uncharacterized protein n=1 Tax=Desmospora activa DSM 45169 TaxID=1121389 RepID=A0A2T4YZT1_9BACL|nr:hypothetical protein [Desmospora activa]PTM52706.1 hypothetical protein C8J48_3699 [Desmospora activa DSM 45169]